MFQTRFYYFRYHTFFKFFLKILLLKFTCTYLKIVLLMACLRTCFRNRKLYRSFLTCQDKKKLFPRTNTRTNKSPTKKAHKHTHIKSQIHHFTYHLQFCALVNTYLCMVGVFLFYNRLQFLYRRCKYIFENVAYDYNQIIQTSLQY